MGTETDIDPQAAELLERLAERGGPPSHALSVKGVREAMQDILVTNNGESVGRIRDVSIDDPGGDIPIRVSKPREAGDGSAPPPTLLYFHGDGWVKGDIETHDDFCRLLTNDVGAMVVSVDYRRPPEHPFPAAVEDCYVAMVWAAEYGDVVDAAGRLDVLVNNAGVTGDGFETRLEEMSPEKFERVLRTNVAGTFYATRTALPHLRETKGNLIFVGSSAGKLPRPGAPVYAASKWWTRGFALSVEAHAGQDGVGVTLVNPTAVRTEMWPDLDPGEAAEPEEVAAVVSLAARQEAHTTLSDTLLNATQRRGGAH